MKAIIKTLALLTLTQLCHAAQAPPQKLAAQQEETITLFIEEAPQLSAGRKLPSYASAIAAQRHTYVMPRDVARQAQTLAHTIDEFPNQKEFPVGTATTPAAMNYITQIMQLMHRNNRLQGKALVDALENEIQVDPKVAFDLLRTANYLDLQPAVEFVARIIAKNPGLIKQLEDATGYFSKQKLLPHEILTKVAWYHYLLNGKELKDADTASLGFSIQDYLDHNPDLIHKRQHRVLNEIFLRQNLIGLRLNSVAELENIPNINQVQILNISKNQLRALQPASFAASTKLFSLTLSNNQLTHLNAGVFDGMRSIYLLDLSYNQIRQIEESTLQRLRQLTSQQSMWELGRRQLDVVNYQYQLIPYAFHSWQPITYLSNGNIKLGPYLMLDHNLLTQENKQRIKEVLQRVKIKV